MANQLFTLQFSIPSGVKQPIIAGDKRTSSINIAKLVRQGLAAGEAFNLAGSAAYLQYQLNVVQATGTVTAAAVQAADAVSVGGQALTAGQKRAAATAEMASVAEDDTITINGNVFTAVDGEVVLGEPTFDCSGTDTQTAASLVAQVAAYESPTLSGLIAAKSAAAVVTLYALTQGTAGNAFSLAVSDPVTIVISGALFTGGAALANNVFDCMGSNELTAEAIAEAINNSTTAAVKQVTATVSGAVCTVTAKVGGTAGNAIAWVSSDGTRLAVSGSGTLASGAADAPVRFSF